MTDQQRADLRKKRGYALDTMPFLDTFSENAVDFECAYTPNPICMAARVSLFTGRVPEAHRVRSNHNRKDVLYVKDILDVLRENGYETALCGKNHSHRNPADFDFARTNGHLGGEGEENATEAEIEFSEFLRSTNHMEVHEPAPFDATVQFPHRNVRDSLEFIDTRDKEKPFFLWLSMAEPHNPSQVPEPYFDMFPPSELPPCLDKSSLEGKSDRYRVLRSHWEKILKDDIDNRIARTRSNYHGMLRLIDDELERLYVGLSERGLIDNTHIVFMSDHGDFVGEYGLLRKGADLSELLVNVSLIWQGPGIKPCTDRENMVSLIDVFPTVCDIIGADIPHGVQGKSMLPLLRGESGAEGEFDTAYSESGYGGLRWTDEDDLPLYTEGASDREYTRYDCLNTYTQCGRVRMVRKGRYKLVIDERGDCYLYDLENDKLEVNNLSDAEQYSAVKTELLAELAKKMMQYIDTLPYPHHRYRVKRHPKGYTERPFVSSDPGVDIK